MDVNEAGNIFVSGNPSNDKKYSDNNTLWLFEAKFPEIAMLASTSFTAAKKKAANKTPPVGLNMMIMDQESNAYLSELTRHVLVRGSFN